MCCRFLIEAGADIEALDPDGGTPVHHAVMGGHVAVVQAFADAGANMTKANREGNTPMSIAFYKGHWDVVRLPRPQCISPGIFW